MRLMRSMPGAAGICGASLLLLASSALACPGDCDGNEKVAISELIRAVGIALGSAPLVQCEPVDQTGEGSVTVDELVRAVDAAIGGCPAPIITTIAGTGIAGLNDDGQPPLDTDFYLPQDVTLGPDGNLYIADWNNHRIRRIKDGVVQTVSGSGELGDAIDGPSLTIHYNHPTGITFDRDGSMIIAAWHNSLIKRVVFPDGLDNLETATVINLAGTGARAFAGDEGPGNQAKLDLPSSTVIDTVGDIVISDQANQRLRLLDPTGTIHTVCGTGTQGYTGDNGPALDAEINSPRGQSAAPAGRIAIDDQDRIYIADTGNHCIRLLDPGDHSIKTIVGNGTSGYSGDGGPALEAQLNGPADIAVGRNGTLYIADTQNNAVRIVHPDGTIDTLAGTGEPGFSGDGGPAKEAELSGPYGLDVAANGDVYVADTSNHRIRKISGVSSGPVPTPRPQPTPVIVPCTDTVGSICTYAGTGGTGFDGDGNDRLHTLLYWPFDIEFTPKGRRIFLDWNNHRVREILPGKTLSDETVVTLVGTNFVGDGPPDLSDLTPEGADPLTVNLNHPTDIQEFSNGDVLFMAWHNHKIREIDHETGKVFVLLGRGPGKTGDDPPLTADQTLVNQPPHGTFDAHGNLFFIDQRNQRIRVAYNFDQDRKNAIVRTVAGNPGDPVTPGFNGDGVALETKFSFPTGGNPEPSGGLAVDPNGVIYFSDTKNNRIRKIEFSSPDFLQGTVTTIAGTGDAGGGGDGGPAIDAQLNFPEDIEIGPDGNLYFADTNNDRVRMIDLKTMTITTIAGVGTTGYSGDGGMAVDAELNRPFGVAFDASGDLYISDTFNSRIRKVKR